MFGNNIISLMPWFLDLEQDVFDPLFSNFTNSGVTWNKSNDAVSVSFDIPGVDKENINATVRNNLVTVTAKQGERSYRYAVKITQVDFDKAKHSYNNGVLTITVPYADSVKEKNLLNK